MEEVWECLSDSELKKCKRFLKAEDGCCFREDERNSFMVHRTEPVPRVGDLAIGVEEGER